MTDLSIPCPECSTVTLPYRAEWDPGGCRAYYRCPSGHRWWTGWGLAPEELAEYEEMAEAA